MASPPKIAITTLAGRTSARGRRPTSALKTVVMGCRAKKAERTSKVSPIRSMLR
jgi:hypothetical protein